MIASDEDRALAARNRLVVVDGIVDHFAIPRRVSDSIAKVLLESGLRLDARELQHVMVSKNVFWFLHLVALVCEGKNAFLVL